jgi:hypothetical protein
MNVIGAGLTGWLLVVVLLIFVVAIWRKWLWPGCKMHLETVQGSVGGHAR